MIKRTVLALIAVFILMMLVSCSPMEPFYAGELLTAEEVEARRAALLAEREANEKTPYNGICYWLEKGSVYHVNPDCTYIVGKTNVRSGTLDEATAAGKERASSLCGK